MDLHVLLILTLLSWIMFLVWLRTYPVTMIAVLEDDPYYTCSACFASLLGDRDVALRSLSLLPYPTTPGSPSLQEQTVPAAHGLHSKCRDGFMTKTDKYSKCVWSEWSMFGQTVCSAQDTVALQPHSPTAPLQTLHSLSPCKTLNSLFVWCMPTTIY